MEHGPENRSSSQLITCLKKARRRRAANRAATAAWSTPRSAGWNRVIEQARKLLERLEHGKCMVTTRRGRVRPSWTRVLGRAEPLHALLNYDLRDLLGWEMRLASPRLSTVLEMAGGPFDAHTRTETTAPSRYRLNSSHPLGAGSSPNPAAAQRPRSQARHLVRELDVE